jgi:hypothetical protein
MTMGSTVMTKNELDLFVEEFPQKMQAWLDSAKFRTPHLLSKLTNIRPNTIYDLMKGRRSVAKLHPTRIVRILSCLEGVEQKDVVTKYQSVLATIERTCGDTELKVDQELSTNTEFTNNFVRIMKNPVALAIYTMSVREKGVSASVIKDQFGNYGEEVLKMLIENKIMVKTNTSFYPINSEFLRLDREQVKEMIPVLNSFYDAKHANQDRNFISMRIDSINRKALYEIYDLYASFDNRMTEILSQPENKGDIPFYGFAQLDTMIDKL